MHLTPHEIDKLTLHQAGFIAQRRLARGLLLNHPEAIALIATVISELIRDGHSVVELMDLGRQILGRADVMEGVPEMIKEVQVEGIFPDGSNLVTVHHPIVAEYGEFSLALFGSFLPIPQRKPIESPNFSENLSPSLGESSLSIVPNQGLASSGSLGLNEGKKTITILVTNRGDRPIQVGSHFPFSATNSALEFDRELAHGMRLDIPACAAIRFEPGETKKVDLLATESSRQ